MTLTCSPKCTYATDAPTRGSFRPYKAQRGASFKLTVLVGGASSPTARSEAAKTAAFALGSAERKKTAGEAPSKARGFSLPYQFLLKSIMNIYLRVLKVLFLETLICIEIGIKLHFIGCNFSLAHTGKQVNVSVLDTHVKFIFVL